MRPATSAAAALMTLLFVLSAVLAGCSGGGNRAAMLESGAEVAEVASPLASSLDPGSLSAAAGAEPSVAANGDVPAFDDADLSAGPRETYSPLDRLGRCGTAIALVGVETMPDEPRGEIGEVRPTGFQVARYGWIEGGYLFNRCHLIGYQLAGENANELNLVTGTRSMNVAGMGPFENEVAGYVRETGNHVLYRVTPVFEGDELVARGVLVEAESVEDGGAGVRLCRWCPNVEPGVEIDYATGENHADGTMAAVGEGEGGRGGAESGSGRSGTEDGSGEEAASSPAGAGDFSEHAYVLNTNSMKFHLPDCPSVADMSPRNRQGFDGTRDEAISLGYAPCGVCKP